MRSLGKEVKLGQTLRTFAKALTCVAIRMSEGQGDGPWEGNRMSESTPPEDQLDSLARHLIAHLQGLEDEDHLVALATNALIILETRERTHR